MRKKISIVLAGAVMALLFSVAPREAEGRITFGCYDRQILSIDEHEVWGAGGWHVNGPHEWWWYQCQSVHTEGEGEPPPGG